MSKHNILPKDFQTHLEKDRQLLSLQRYYTDKISSTKDETLIRHYLAKCQRLGEERLELLKNINRVA